MTEDEMRAMFPRLAALPLPPRPQGVPVDKSIQKADHHTPRPKQITVWGDDGQPIPIDQEEEIPE